MSAMQFVGQEARQTFDAEELGHFVKNSAFASGEIDIRKVWLPFGYRGLLAHLRRK